MDLEPGRLTMARAFELAPLIRQQDRLECGKERDPLSSMLRGLAEGDAWVALTPGSEALGVFGYTRGASIWSLWKDLSGVQSRAVLRHTPIWVTSMVKASGHSFLFNFVSVTNGAAVGWLEASRCFDIDYRAVPRHEGTPWSYPAFGFKTKALFHRL